MYGGMWFMLARTHDKHKRNEMGGCGSRFRTHDKYKRNEWGDVVQVLGHTTNIKEMKCGCGSGSRARQI